MTKIEMTEDEYLGMFSMYSELFMKSVLESVQTDMKRLRDEYQSILCEMYENIEVALKDFITCAIPAETREIMRRIVETDADDAVIEIMESMKIANKIIKERCLHNEN